MGHQLTKMFVHHISAANRLQAVADTSFNKRTQAATHPAHVLFSDPELEKKISSIVESLFGSSLMLNPGLGSALGFHFGEQVDATQFGGDRCQEYANALEEVPPIQDARDGIKAAVGLILQTIAFSNSVSLVDEPDLYLHPPQAYSLAKLMAENNPNGQLVLATHSARFVQGLVEAAEDRLTLIRLERSNASSSVHVADTSVFQQIKDDPVLKFTSIVDGLFYKSSVICEDANDCLLYRYAVEKVGRSGLDDETLWLSASGKYNFAKMIRTSMALSVRPVCVADFDLISQKEDTYKRALVPMLEAYGESPSEIVNLLENEVFPAIKSNSKVSWESLKANGIEDLKPYADIFNAVESVLDKLKVLGVLVVREGELESLHVPRLPGKGLPVVNEILNIGSIETNALQPLKRIAKELAKMVK